MPTIKVQRVEPEYHHNKTSDGKRRMRLYAIRVVVERRASTASTTTRVFVFRADDDGGVLRHTQTTTVGHDNMHSTVPNRRAAMLVEAAKALRGWVDMVGRDYEIVTPTPQESDAAIAYDL